MGFKDSFMQGLCSFGFSCRMAIDTFIPLQPERMKRMAAQMTAVLYPDAHVRLQLWKMGEGVAYFRFVNTDTGEIVLNRGVFEWSEA